jgi:gas vesicle protein
MRDRIYYSKEAQQRANRDRFLLVAIVSLIGVAGGALIMLLLAPRSGDETRQQIASAVSEAAERSGEATQQAVKQLNEELRELRQKIEARTDGK